MRVPQVDLQFPREGIDYDSLSDEEQEQWESLDWGDDVDEHGLPAKVNAAAINSWLFNKDTVDKVLQYLMEHGHTVEGVFKPVYSKIKFWQMIGRGHATLSGAVRSGRRQAGLPRLRLLLQFRLLPRESRGS